MKMTNEFAYRGTRIVRAKCADEAENVVWKSLEAFRYFLRIEMNVIAYDLEEWEVKIDARLKDNYASIDEFICDFELRTGFSGSVCWEGMVTE